MYHHYGSICLCKIKIQGKENFIYGVSVNYDGTGTGFAASKVYLFSKVCTITNTHLALILPGLFSVFGVLLMRQVFMQIPFEYTEAAYLDGASHPAIFLKLILPLAKPGLMTALLLAFSWSWNDYINPLVFLSNDKLFTLTVGLQRFQEDASTNYALIMAGATVSLIPLIILFLFTQKYFIESFASAGVKG